MIREYMGTILMTVSLCAVGVQAEEANPGRAAYLKYCGACHGPEGKGDGVVATVLRPKPIDLTQLAKNKGGRFPRADVQDSIDGRKPIQAHGETGMPVWGQVFTESKGFTLTAQPEVRGQLQLITEYVQSIQAH